MRGASRTGDKSAIQNKELFKFYNDGFIYTSNSEQKEISFFVFVRNLMMGLHFS